MASWYTNDKHTLKCLVI